jgi:hypothetical protein
MARIRNIKPDTFVDPDLAELGFAARYFFIGLWCQADKAGRLHDEPKKLAVQILPFDMGRVDADVLLSELAPKFISRYNVAGKRYIQIVNFLRHQRPNIKEADSVIPAEHGKESVGTEKKVQERLIKGSGRGSGSGKGRELTTTATAAGITPAESSFQQFVNGVLKDYFNMKPGDPDPKAKAAVSAAYRRYGRAARDIMAFAEGDPEVARKGLDAVGRHMNAKGLDWNLETVAKRFPEWKVDPNGYEKSAARA